MKLNICLSQVDYHKQMLQSDDDSGEDIFLPTEFDRLRAQVQGYRRRLAAATAKEQQLKRHLIEENLSFVTITYYTKLIQDPTQIYDHELTQLQREVFDKFLSRAEGCCIRECISYHRLSGRTVFNFNNNSGHPLECIRLDTFYDQTYKEPYYIVYNKNELERRRTQLKKEVEETGLPIKSLNKVTEEQPALIEHHTIPNFIAIDTLQEQHLPHNLNAFIRIIHHQLQAYIVKREILNDIATVMRERQRRNTVLRNYVYAEYHKPATPIKVLSQTESLNRVQLQFTPPIAAVYDTRLEERKGVRFFIDLEYGNPSSSYPTKISIKKIGEPSNQLNEGIKEEEEEEEEEESNFVRSLEKDLKMRRLNHVLIDILDFTADSNAIDKEMDIDQ
ncbi:hypothetical protein BDF20DRAFT_834071 [Mycotypha africana]|uniref:uncharacterized protein n=1 Tax=Mycotypha africana TaxID=64632 RepID=UPI0023013DC2|nr:uncharacterized protein BDF20DRAFT_834071 [Mycotypha africana]KAI8984575.1 hypothetical protein BDF20DRAFT_834071 [Mycotypha africana]